MFDLVLPKGSYRRANGSLPPFILVNMCAEETPSAEGGVSLMSLPGLLSTTTLSGTSVDGLYRKADLFNGDTFAVVGTALYRGSVAIGVIDGSGPITWANSDIELVVTRGGSAWSYNGTNLQAIVFPSAYSVTSVTYLAGLFVFAAYGTDRFYWSAVKDARTIDELDFASAESAPDGLLDTLAVGDTLGLAGKETIEFWYPTGSQSLPFSRINQRTTSVGVAATGCLVEHDNAYHFVGSDRAVYRMADVPTRISHHGIDELLANSATFACFTFLWEGHKMLCVRLDTSTQCFDVTTGQWHERASWGLDNWRAKCAVEQADGTVLFGASDSASLLIHSGWADNGDPYSREFTAAIPLKASTPIDEIEITTNPGEAPLTIADPRLEMRFSRDGGKTFKQWRSASLGATGKYGLKPKFRRLGMFRSPGALFQFRVTDAVDFRVSGSVGGNSAAGRSV
jgi:hypothetical protein